MTARTTLELTCTAFNAIASHAQETYPEECCGVILSDGGGSDEVCRLSNIQNVLHEKDPETFPRDARTAYTMDYRALDTVLSDAERKGLKIKAFYHSHPDHDAYFSAEDKAFATPFGEPTYPETAQIVISVREGIVANVGVYKWNAAIDDFVGVEMERVSDR
jgi:proteasome lid subunit RPN8/RPN11